MHFLRPLALACLVALITFPAHARRVALVIGNADYQVGPLANPVNDANAIAQAFQGLGFDKIIRATNATKAQMEKALAEMSDEAVGAEMAVVYFAGHGTERDGQNFLIPVDARLNRASDLGTQAIRLSDVLDQLNGATKLKLVILDACRNNVFPLQGAQRMVTRGLARVEPANNTLVFYAAKDGTTADDGPGQPNSPFTGALLKHLPTPGLEIRILLAAVTKEVRTITNQRQEPYHYGTMDPELIYIMPPVGGGGATASKIDDSADLIAAINALTKPSTIARFTWHSNPAVRTAAQARLVLLERSGAPAAMPASSVASTPIASTPVPTALDPIAALVPGSGQSARDRLADGRECRSCPEMVVIPTGSFLMGSTSAEKEKITRQRPELSKYFSAEEDQRRVDMPVPFAVGVSHVTRGEFESFIEASGHVVSGPCAAFDVKFSSWRPQSSKTWRAPGFSQSKLHPVVCIDFNDANAYVAWLSRATGKEYRLLSSREAEYVTRATNIPVAQGQYSFGDDMAELCKYANFSDSSWMTAFPGKGSNVCRDGYSHSAPVKSFKENRWGIFDAHGNVFSWTGDLAEARLREVNQQTQKRTNADARIARGGSYHSIPEFVRSAYRSSIWSNERTDFLGLRVARKVGA